MWLPYVVSANAGFVTKKLREIGGFDETFKSGNDVDICYRLGLSGCTINLVPEAIILHEDRVLIREHYRRFRDYAIYQVLLYAKYKHLSGKRFILNPYPFRRLVSTLTKLPNAFVRMLKGDPGPLAVLFLQIVEVIGIWCGDIRGSIRYKQLYL
jgi:GT2 family glycosyltransferase